jgi:hypothetical protein
MRIRVFLLLIFIQIVPASEILTDSTILGVIKNLRSRTSLSNTAIDASALAHAKRLEIQYQDISQKILIGEYAAETLDLIRQMPAARIKQYIQKKGTKWLLDVSHLNQNNTPLRLAFNRDKYIPPVAFFTEQWPVVQSRYFNYHANTTNAIVDENLASLDNFVDEVFDLFKVGTDKRNLLSKRKIDYFLCRDNSQIQQISGYSTRGMAHLGLDYVISTFKVHKHEVAHLLINYILGEVPLYCHPFLQEGFAVAIGGRGGQSPRVINDVGVYLLKTGYISVREVTNRQKFYQQHTSMTYPLSGAINREMLWEMSAQEYLTLYRAFCHQNPDSIPMSVDIERIINTDKITLAINPVQPLAKNTFKFGDKSMYEYSDRHYFSIAKSYRINHSNSPPSNQSKVFNDAFPEEDYDGCKYLIIADGVEISVYNCFADELIARYTPAFSLPPKPIQKENGRWIFRIDSDIFE